MIRKPYDGSRIRSDPIGHQEVQQTPQFHQIVLQRRTGEKQTPLCLETKESLPSLTAEVLDIVGLVQDHIYPALPSKDVLIGKHDLVRCDAHLPSMLGMPTNPLLLPLLLVAVVGEDLKTGKELLELHLPIEDDRSRNDNEVLTPYAFVACKMTEK